MLTQSPETLGQGKLWAIHQAQEMSKRSLDDALVRCEGHAMLGEEMFTANHATSRRPEIRTATRFGSGIAGIIADWLESEGEQLPVRHVDFGIDLSNQILQVGEKRILRM